MALQITIYDILQQNYPLDDILTVLAKLALEVDEPTDQLMSQAYNLFVGVDSSAEGYVYFTPESYTYTSDRFQSSNPRAEMTFISENLGQLMLNNAEEREYLDGMKYVADLNIQVIQPDGYTGEKIQRRNGEPPYLDLLDIYFDNPDADRNELSSWFDSERGVWIAINGVMDVTIGDNFDDAVSDVVDFMVANGGLDADPKAQKTDREQSDSS